MLSQPMRFLLFMFAGWLRRRQQEVITYLLEENKILREQLPDGMPRLNDKQRRRLAVKGKILGRKLLDRYAGIVTPDTILRWYRRLIAKKYDSSKTRKPGRPRTKPNIAELVVRMSRENPSWGYTRIRDALAHFGHEISRNTIKCILKEHSSDAPIICTSS
jgi:transposase